MSCCCRFALVLVVCMACVSDAPPDSSRGTVHVTVLHPHETGAWAVGADVVFIDPDGTVVKRVATDTKGRAAADVLPGASVTSIALEMETSAYQIQSVLDVQPGDDLILGVNSSAPRFVGTFTVAFPPYTQVMPASYEVAGPCGIERSVRPASGEPPPAQVTLRFSDDCKLDAMEIVVQANDGSGNPIAVLSQNDVAFVANGSTTIGGTYERPRTFALSAVNVDPNVTSLLMQRTVPDGFGLTASAMEEPPMAIQMMSVTGAIGSSALIDTQITSATGAYQLVRQAGSGSSLSYALDLGATLLPWLGEPRFDAGTGKILVPNHTPGTIAPDFVRLKATYERTDPASGAQTSYTWTVFSPVAADFLLPYLPYQIRNVMPTASDTVTVTAIALDTDAVTSYDEVRSDLNAALSKYVGVRPPGTTLRRVSSSPSMR